METKRETFRIEMSELVAFKRACDKVSGIEFLDYTDGWAELEYEFAHNLFYLGMMLQLQKK